MGKLQAHQPGLGMGKVMEQIALSGIMWHVWDNPGIRPRHRKLPKSRSCLANLISFYEWVIQLVDEGKAVDELYLIHSIILRELAVHDLDRYTLC